MKEVKYTGQPYDVSASTEWGVPLKISPYIEGENWGRSTVEAVYQQIVSDLKDAVDHLSGLPARSYYWANVLSRVYCYMGKWDLVPELCDDVLEQNKYGLQDLVPMIANDSVNGWVGPASPEIIFTQGSYSLNTLTYDGANSSTTIASYQISSALKELFVDGDKRKDFLYRRSPSNDNVKYSQKIKQKKTEGNAVYLSDVFLLRLPEVYLNKAEALAMTGKEGDAREALRLLMEKRFMPDALPAITESGKGLIDLIRNERRREFCFEGQRWFDLRRYAVSPKYPDAKKIRHDAYEYGTGNKTTPGTVYGYYELPAYPDGGWVLPIPAFEIEQNDGKMIGNERGNCIFLKIIGIWKQVLYTVF